METKYYFIPYRCKTTSWQKRSETEGYIYISSHEQLYQKITDVHPIKFQLDCNEKYENIIDGDYQRKEEYLVLNWIPLTKEEYEEFKGKVG
jgi:hypothetical protein